jgi:hypothetical protein
MRRVPGEQKRNCRTVEGLSRSRCNDVTSLTKNGSAHSSAPAFAQHRLGRRPSLASLALECSLLLAKAFGVRCWMFDVLQSAQSPLLNPARAHPLDGETRNLARIFQLKFLFDVGAVSLHGFGAEMQKLPDLPHFSAFADQF